MTHCSNEPPGRMEKIVARRTRLRTRGKSGSSFGRKVRALCLHPGVNWVTRQRTQSHQKCQMGEPCRWHQQSLGRSELHDRRHADETHPLPPTLTGNPHGLFFCPRRTLDEQFHRRESKSKRFCPESVLPRAQKSRHGVCGVSATPVAQGERVGGTKPPDGPGCVSWTVSGG